MVQRSIEEGAVLLLGGGGFVAGHVARALRADGRRVLLAGRRQGGPYAIDDADVLADRTSDPDWWRSRVASAAGPGERIGGIVNLVTRKAGERAEIEATNVRAVAAMQAARRGLGAPLTLHLGSVSEYRTSTHASGYAAGKRAARAACLRGGEVDLVLTLGVVTGRSGYTKTSRTLRRVLRALPRLRSSVTVGVSPVTEVAEAVSVLMRHGRPLAEQAGERPVELVLSGRPRSWGRYLDLPDRAGDGAPPPAWLRPVIAAEPYAWRPLTLLEGSHAQWSDRLGSMARIATGDRPEADHYRLTANRPAVLDRLEREGGTQLGRWWVVACDGGAGRCLVKP